MYTNLLSIYNSSDLLSKHLVYTELYRMYMKLLSIYNVFYLFSNNSVYTELFRMYTKFLSIYDISNLLFNHIVYTELYRMYMKLLSIYNISYLLSNHLVYLISNHPIYTKSYGMYMKLLSIYNISYSLSNHSVYTEARSCHVGTPSDIQILPPTPYLLTHPHYYCEFIHVDGPIKVVLNCYNLQIRGSVIVTLSFKIQQKSEIIVKSRRIIPSSGCKQFCNHKGNLVEPGYYDIRLYVTSFIVLATPWYQLIPHC